MSEGTTGKRTRRSLEPPLVEEAGHVFVTFDAGGQGTSVNPNPVQPRLHEDGWATIEWHLDAELRRNPQWTVRMGNVVLCEQGAIAGLEHAVKDGGLTWIWRFPWRHDIEGGQAALVPYDLFFVYGQGFFQLSDGGGEGEARPLPVERYGKHRQVASLRQVLTVDPSILLPPEPPLPHEGPEPRRARSAGGGRRTRAR